MQFLFGRDVYKRQGPLGVEFKNNVKRAWWQKFVQESKYNVGVDCAILMNLSLIHI